eukprot:11750407-Alexandrium_andersonii.AAC.1
MALLRARIACAGPGQEFPRARPRLLPEEQPVDRFERELRTTARYSVAWWLKRSSFKGALLRFRGGGAA